MPSVGCGKGWRGNHNFDKMKDEIVAILEQAKAEIQGRMESEGINASGRSSASFSVEPYDGGVRLVYGGAGTAPLPTLEVGREGGNVPKGFTDILVQWSIDKGIPFELSKTGKDTRRRSFAYLLGRRIQREGTLRHKQPVDVYTTAVMDAVDKVEESLAVAVTRFIHKQLIK